MNSGILAGLAAALCWGVADFFARGATRLAGTYRTLVAVQIVAIAAFLVLCLPTGALRLGPMPVGDVLMSAVLGLVILAGAGLLYRAFAIGPLALTSPIAASFAAVTALLAIVLSGEHPKPGQLAGIVVTLAGVALASTVPGHPTQAKGGRLRIGPLRAAPGVIEALGAMIVFGVAYWRMRYAVAALGGIRVAFINKVGDLVGLLALAAVLALANRWRRREPRGEYGGPAPRLAPFLVFAAPTALLDTAANVAYNLGVASSLTSVVSVLSSLFSPVTVLLAWLFLRERLARWQWVGVAAIFAGVVLVSM